MTYKERKEKEKHLLYLVEMGWLTSIEKVAKDYGCSKRTILRMISSLREEGYNIQYCKKRFKYYVK